MERGRGSWIPKEDVDALYRGAEEKLPPGRDEFDLLREQMSALQKEMNVLKLGLGFSAPRALRNEKDTFLLRQQFLDAMGKPAWSNLEISQLADALLSVREEELLKLHKEFGPRGWTPFIDMTTRALLYIENHPYYPDRGLDVLHERALRARGYFYGMLHAARVTTTPLPRKTATAILKRQARTEAPISEGIFKYAVGRAERAQT